MSNINKKSAGRTAVCLMKTLLLTVILFSCTNEPFTPETLKKSGETECVFTVNLPAQVKTYALTDANENDITRINVLAFEYNSSSGQYLLADWSAASETINGSGAQKTFTVKFGRLTQGDKYKFVILGNAENEINYLFSTGITTGALKNDILTRLTLTGITRWVMNPSDGGYRHIPMWGETPSQNGTGDVIINETTSITGLKLLRMVARINVTIDNTGTPAAKDVFKLKSVHLYNTHRAGHIAPAMENLESSSVTKVHTPTLVSGSPVFKGPILYDSSIDGSNITDSTLTNNIYTFESALPYNAGKLETDKMTCIVIGGIYGTDQKATYYRVDFIDKEKPTQHLDILRNHSYNVKVVKVNGRGYESEEEAFNAKAVNLETEVIIWNDASVTEIVFNDQYMLGVSQGEFTFSREARTATSTDNTLTITTDYPGGWKIDKIINNTGTSVSWLNTDVTSWPENTSKDIKLLIPEENNTGQPRVAYIHITAGRLTYVVTVTQNTDSLFGIQITDLSGNVIDELLFFSEAGLQPALQQFKATWTPKTIESAIASQQTGSVAFDFGAGHNLSAMSTTNSATLGTPGEQTFIILPPAITLQEVIDNPFIEKSSKVDFTINHQGNTQSKSIDLRQINYALIGSGYEEYFLMDGSQYSFTVKANTEWTAQITKDEKKVLKSLDIKSGSGNTTIGELVKFTLVDDMYGSVPGSIVEGTFDITFTHANNKFSPVTYTINCGTIAWAGSNIYWDGSKLTFDNEGITDHQHYQGVFFKWGSLWGISPSSNGEKKWSELNASDRIVYIPNSSGNGYIQSTASEWTTIPFINDHYIDINTKQRYLTNEVHKADSISAGKGDICKYLTEQSPSGTLYGRKWRMPTSKEFGSKDELQNYTPSGSFIDITSIQSINSTSKAGKYVNTNSSGYHMTSPGRPTVFFPASGNRGATLGTLSEIGTSGHYWSSSPDKVYGFHTHFEADSVSSTYYGTRTYGFSIRCVAGLE